LGADLYNHNNDDRQSLPAQSLSQGFANGQDQPRVQRAKAITSAARTQHSLHGTGTVSVTNKATPSFASGAGVSAPDTNTETVMVAADAATVSRRRLSAKEVIWSSHSITPSESARALLFESRGLMFALPADSVNEVIDVPATQSVAGAAAWFEGVSVYRSRPVPVIDVAGYLAPDTDELAFNRAVVVRVASSTYLVAAEKILNLCSLPVTDYIPELYNLPEYTRHRAIKKVCQYENRLLAVIDLPELLRCTKLLRECAFC